MTKEWYEETVILKKIPNFSSTNVNYIKGFNYYIGYNPYYDEVSYLEVDFLVEVDRRKYMLKMKFNDVSVLDLIGFGNSYNQLMGFTIHNLSKNGFELDNKYLVEDYEDNIIKFYCASFEVLSLVEI
ncbi:hypothetical protein FJQ98_18300 [Lysinibacillus agricola]|uniref:Uncharacterized protein n=1 Tax=Lysinibacillus agricola TaxID=2590012 RepID=A0ABX7ASE8_9BACI|nr:MULTISPECIES: hypothetical protein [Lysinibacillus]KOS60594.1 hypothetical protein AN161_22235 [Lysinibacillus sp. FJAT-14222]QQP11164.1 hypothetical protein FJQ98_18300 [Lysinibacillus agricola]